MRVFSIAHGVDIDHHFKYGTRAFGGIRNEEEDWDEFWTSGIVERPWF